MDILEKKSVDLSPLLKIVKTIGKYPHVAKYKFVKSLALVIRSQYSVQSVEQYLYRKMMFKMFFPFEEWLHFYHVCKPPPPPPHGAKG